MAQIVDEYGEWEVVEGVGCINRLMVTPTQKWIDENPVVSTPDVAIQPATILTKLKAWWNRKS